MELGLHIGLETDLFCRAFHFVPGLDSGVCVCMCGTVTVCTSGCVVQFIGVLICV